MSDGDMERSAVQRDPAGGATLPAELIRAKRDGRALDAVQIGAFVRGLVDGSWSEGQVAAFAMATLLRGMTGRTITSTTT